ncbi:MAG: histidinol dehydrogenase, partial [Deltaproteobacteria bacterium]|nr:histidinol dehydrogenase [Deltaproteobacteria bacterium]
VAAHLGVSEIYGISGAQGIAALAFGTESVPRVDKIVGPGNARVQTAKKLVYGSVGIDSLAGPSEVAILADDDANSEFTAIDLLAQAEHGSGYEAAVCFVLSQKKAEEIKAALNNLVAKYDLAAAVTDSLSRYGNIFIVKDFHEAVRACEIMAPEHIELHCQNPEELIGGFKTFGALFVGPWTPEVAGDYFAGSNHVLPTQGTARFSSGLTVADFMRSSALVRYTKETMQRNAASIALLARKENLRAHELSAKLRGEE